MASDTATASFRHRRPGPIAALPDATLLVSLGVVAVLTGLRFVTFFPLAQGEFGYAAWVEDDFFYYAVTAQNIADTGKSTFDGVSLTNGYHPLWMAVCTGLAAIFGIKSVGFFFAVFLIQSLLVVAGVVAFAALARKLMDAGLISRAGQMVGAACYGAAFTLTGANGMEVALLAPLAPLLLLSAWKLCETRALRDAVIAGGLLCAVVLSRLDMVVVFAPLGAGVVYVILKRDGLPALLKLLPAVITFAPLAIYIATNIAVFGGAMPISGQAKRLMIDGAPIGFSEVALASFFPASNPNYLFAPVAPLVLTLAGAVLALALPRIRNAFAGIGFLLLVAGVALFYLQAALTSDWMLWPWYFSPLMISGAIGAALLTDAALRLTPPRFSQIARWSAPVVCGLVLVTGLRANLWLIKQPPSVSNSLFTRAIPLEGLVNDRTFLEELEEGGSLAASLKRQGVDYYITSEVMRPAVGCAALVEPRSGGPRVSRLHETVCEKPIFEEQTGWVHSQIWDVRDGLS
jgi:hypothetical protein